MDAVLQKSMDMTVELTASGKSGRQGCTVATLRAERVSSIPVDHDNKNNNSVVLAGSFFNSISFRNKEQTFYFVYRDISHSSKRKEIMGIPSQL